MSSNSAWEYMVDAAQRNVLFWDVMRQRGEQYREHMAQAVPHVLHYEVQLVVDGRTLPRPVNYGLTRVVPPNGVKVDPKRRPFVIIDPRAGHGPGIGGFKADSEIGVAMKAGHPCYFVGFGPDPMPGQTIEDIVCAEAIFMEKVLELHPNADAKPCVIGNCQAGWALMMLTATRPELFGPIIIAGSPLSYWAGVRGKKHALHRWLAGRQLARRPSSAISAAASSTAHGWWRTSRASTQPIRFGRSSTISIRRSTRKPRAIWSLSAGGAAMSSLNAEEIQFIVDELFVGNNLAAGRVAGFGRNRGRPSQHPLPHRRVLLEGRQHHAPAAGARLDPRSL